MDKLNYKRTLVTGSLTILVSETTSSTYFDCGGMQLRAILLPSSFTPGNLSFNVSDLPPTDPFFQSYQLSDTTGTVISIAATPSQWISLSPYLTDSIPYLQIACSVSQASQITIKLALEPIYQGIHG